MKQYINKVNCINAMDLLKQIPDKSIDLVLTDPPYNAGRAYANDKLNEKEYLKFTDSYLKESKRILKEDGNIIIIIGIKYFEPVFNKLSKYFNYNWQFVLYKNNGMLNGKASFAKWDSVLWFSNGDSKHQRIKDGFGSTDVWKCPINPEKNKFGHPTPKDLKPIELSLLMFSEENQLILDPFMGSWTTAVACQNLKRNFIGSELDSDYCEIGRQRLRQKTLF